MELNMDLNKMIRMCKAVHEIGGINFASGVPQANFVMEEAAEFIKARSKISRGKDTQEHLIEEVMDMVSAVFVLLDQENIPLDKLWDHIIFKCERAIERNRKDGEI